MEILVHTGILGVENRAAQFLVVAGVAFSSRTAWRQQENNSDTSSSMPCSQKGSLSHNTFQASSLTLSILATSPRTIKSTNCVKHQQCKLTSYDSQLPCRPTRSQHHGTVTHSQLPIKLSHSIAERFHDQSVLKDSGGTRARAVALFVDRAGCECQSPEAAKVCHQIRGGGRCAPPFNQMATRVYL